MKRLFLLLSLVLSLFTFSCANDTNDDNTITITNDAGTVIYYSCDESHLNKSELAHNSSVEVEPPVYLTIDETAWITILHSCTVTMATFGK